MKNNRKSILSNDYVFSIISRISAVVISIFHAAFLARFLGPELKGVAASISSVVAVGSIVITGGIHHAFPYYRKKRTGKDFLNKFCSNVLILYAVLFSLSVFIVFIDSVDIVVKGSILLIPIFGYETIINYVFLIEASKKRNVTNVLANFIETAVLFVFWLAIEPNNIFMVIGISVSVIIKAFISTLKVGFTFSIKYFDLKYLLELLKFGFLPMVALLLTNLNSRVDILMLNAYDSVSSAQIGIYSAGVGLAEKALLIPDAIREILLGKLVAGKDKEEVAKACRIGTFISLCVAVCVVIFGRLAIRILFGQEYSSAYGITFISSCGAIFMVYIKMVSQYNIVHKKQKSNAFLLLLSVGVNVSLNLVLIPKLNITGAAIATFAGHLVCGMSFLIFYKKATGLSFKQMVLLQSEDLKLFTSLFLKIKK